MCVDDTPDHDCARDSASFDFVDAKAHAPVVDQDVVPGPEDLRENRRAHWEVTARAVTSPVSVTRSPGASSSGRLELSDPELRALQVGDQGEWAPGTRLRLADERAPSAWSACAPCEKFSRAASNPASTSASIISGDEEAGPIVQTIFVRRWPLFTRSR